MENKEWKEVEEDDKKRKSNIIGKYGFDIVEFTEERLKQEYGEKRRKRNNIIKLIIIVLTISLVLFRISIVNKQGAKTMEEKMLIYLEETYNMDFEILSKKTYWKGRGFYTLALKDIPELEFNCVISGADFENNFSSDFVSRYYKYYFEKWNDECKSNFVENEVYEDNVYKFVKEKNSHLTYYTYIEVSNYDEMLVAVNDIIKFIEYIGNGNILIGSYTYIYYQLIIPHGTMGETNEEIINNAIKQYQDIMKMYK